MSLGELQNKKIVVLDFERNIQTSQGDGRYVVQFEMNGKKAKFITNSEEMKSDLEQAESIGKIPFKTTIKRVVFGDNKVKYIFA